MYLGGVSKMAKVEVKDSLSFIFAGRAEFTIENVLSGVSYKYKVSKSQRDDMYYVCVKSGSEWVYAGYLRNKDGLTCYKQGQKGELGVQEPAIKGLVYAIKKGNRTLPRPMLMYHHGKCGCCGRSLDDEESILRGFGPVCWSRLSESHKNKIKEDISTMSLF